MPAARKLGKRAAPRLARLKFVIRLHRPSSSMLSSPAAFTPSHLPDEKKRSMEYRFSKEFVAKSEFSRSVSEIREKGSRARGRATEQEICRYRPRGELVESNSTGGLDVKLPLQIATMNGASGQGSGRCLHARSPAKAGVDCAAQHRSDDLRPIGILRQQQERPYQARRTHASLRRARRRSQIKVDAFERSLDRRLGLSRRSRPL